MDCWWRIIVISRKESSGSQNPSDLGQRRSWFHPVERLGTRDDVSTPIRQASLMSNSLSILDVCRVGMVLDFAHSLDTHVSIRLDTNHPLGPLPRSRLKVQSRCPNPPPGRDAAGQSTVSADRAMPVAASGAPDRSCWLCPSKFHWNHACCLLLLFY